MRNIYLQIPSVNQEVEKMALATIVRTRGSTPQKHGNSALFDASGLVAGTVGGGILEGKITEAAKNSIRSKRSSLFTYTLDSSLPLAEDALCGGSVTLIIDAALGDHLAAFNEMRRSVSDRIPGILITMVAGADSENIRIKRYWMTGKTIGSIPPDIVSGLKPVTEDILRRPDPSGYREVTLPSPGNKDSVSYFLQPVIPSPRLIIAGAGHIGKALSAIGQMLDFEVTVIDDRSEFANADNLPSADHIVVNDVGKALEDIDKGDDTFIVIVTHGHKDDAKALRACISSSAAYIGMIGSRNKVESMHREFIQNRWATSEEWARIFSPVGLDISSRSVEEIAVSIAAQIIRIKNTKKA